MKHASLLIALSAASLFACGKPEELPEPAVEPPAAEAVQAAPTTAAPEVEAPPAVQPEVAPAAPAAAGKTAPEPAKLPPAKPVAATQPAPAADAAQPDLAHGQQIYRQACAFCHDKGVAGAPKIGDIAAWTPRLAQGMDTLYTSALRGKRAMPPKGGNPSLADADVRAAADYLVAQSR